jgi:hypothetical protein
VRWARPLALALLAASCSADDRRAPVELQAGRLGASIARLDDGRVAVVDPDVGSVSLLDPVTLAPLARIEVGGEPHSLLPLGGRLLVANYRGGEVVVIDLAAGAVATRRAICAGPWGLAASPAGDFVAVSCEWSGSVWRLDPATLAGSEVIGGLSRPRAVAVAEGDILVADFIGGLVRRIPAGGAPATATLVPAAAPYRPALTAMTANLTTAFVSARGRLYATHLLENHDGNTTAESVADDYGSVADDHPKINPALTGISLADGGLAPGHDEPVIYARYDGGSRVFSGPSAAARADADHLLIAHESTRNVALIDLSSGAPGGRAAGSYAVGAGPAGVAVDAAARVAFVDNALDRSVSRLDLAAPLSAGPGPTPAALTRTRPLPGRYSAAALAGRKVFHDASDPHLTPAGVVACSTCHPGGGDDGLVWFIHTGEIPTKRRRTPHLAGARSTAAPFHWDGGQPDIPTLVHATVTTLMAGDGLLVDGDAVRAYLDEIVQAPALPAEDAAQAGRGQALFGDLGCAGCHAGPDRTDGQRHAVLDPVSLSPDDGILQVDTPGLRGLFLRAPYFHDGRSPGLRDALDRPDAARHRQGATLTPAQLDDLVAYLRTL